MSTLPLKKLMLLHPHSLILYVGVKNDERLFGLGNECHLFRITICKFTLMLQEVTSQIWATLYDYPCLKDCPGLRIYIDKCVRVSWGLVNQVMKHTGAKIHILSKNHILKISILTKFTFLKSHFPQNSHF